MRAESRISHVSIMHEQDKKQSGETNRYVEICRKYPRNTSTQASRLEKRIQIWDVPKLERIWLEGRSSGNFNVIWFSLVHAGLLCSPAGKEPKESGVSLGFGTLSMSARCNEQDESRVSEGNIVGDGGIIQTTQHN